MTSATSLPDDLYALFDDLCDGLINETDAARLDALLCQNQLARQEYLAYVEVHAGLALVSKEVTDDRTCDADDDFSSPESQEHSIIPAIIVDPTPATASPRFWHERAAIVAYSVSAIVILIALCAGWVHKISHTSEVAQREPAKPQAATLGLPRKPDVALVGRVTAAIDCQWADATAAVSEGMFLSLGQDFSLLSGLLEITYDSGSVVLLQGPCTYRVQSPTSGFLAIGALTARVERLAPAGETSPQGMANGNALAGFTVCTPTAVVTDLGTEFGVKVDRFGSSRADVFRGKIRMRLVAEQAADSGTIELGESESARVERNSKRDGVNIFRITSTPEVYVRQIPKRIPIQLANTGTGLKEGQPDPHWQVVARSDVPDFVPVAATVATIRVFREPNDPTGNEYTTHLSNQPEQSQWLSLTRAGEMPNHVTYTFRTEFELTDRSLKSVVMRLRYLVDDRVTQVRLNGKKIDVPAATRKSFAEWQSMKIDDGFVDGRNVLEIDVYNDDAVATRAASPMLFRAELEGSAVQRWNSSKRDATAQKMRSS